MNVTRIAVRNIWRQKKRSILLGGAIAFGVMIIVLIGSFTRGITNTASANFTDIFGGHVFITGQELTESGRLVSVVRERDVLEPILRSLEDRIEKRHVRSRTTAEIIFGSRSTALLVEGIDWRDEPELIGGLRLVAGEITEDFGYRSLALPASAAEELGVEAGETVLARTSTVTGQQTVAEFEIRAIIDDESAFGFGISSGYADRYYLNEIIGISPEDYQALNLSLRDPTQAGAATQVITEELARLGKIEEPSTQEEGMIAGMRERMGAMQAIMGAGGMFASSVEEAARWEGTRFLVLNIDDMMESVNSMVSILNTVAYVIFAVLLVITMVGLLNTFRMILIERTREIGTMRAMGMQRTEVRKIFLAEALALALGGAAAGLVVSLALSGGLGLIRFATDSPLQLFLSGDRFTFPVVPGNILVTLAIISAVTLASAYLPARRAARMDPAVALRTHY